MNALFLVAAMAVVLVFGYRFYAKLLALDVFGLDVNYSTPAQSRADGRDYVPTHPHLLFGHHVAAVSGAATFAAPIVALEWGWVPAFLWITIGAAVAAGTYGLGSFWLSIRHPESLGQLGRNLVGRYTRTALLLLILPALFIVAAASAGLSATLLAAYPHAVLPLAAVGLIALAFGSHLHGRAESDLAPVSVGAFAGSLFLVWLLGGTPFAFSGALAISFGDRVWISVDAVVVWVVLLMVYAFHAARLPVWKLMRPRGFLTSLLLAVLLVLFYGAMLVGHPTLDAPQFYSTPPAARALPWLFLVVGTGALAGWQLLIIHGVTGREMRRETDARYIGYGAALVEGLIALSALLIAATAFAGREQWAIQSVSTPGAADFPGALAFYVNQFARHVAVLGLDPLIARTLAATVLAGLSLAVLEAAVRALKHLSVEIAPPRPARSGRPDGARVRLWLVVAGAALLALHDARGLGGLAAWPLLALISLWLAAAGFGLMAFALRIRRRPILIPAALAAGVAVIAAWSSVVQLLSWWRASAWIGLGGGIAILLLVLVVLSEAIRAARRPVAPASRGETATELDT